MNVHGKKVRLRAIEREDLALLHRWGNDPEIWNLLVGWNFPRSYASLESWFERLPEDRSNQRFAIETGEDGLIGTANLVDIDWKNNHAFHGMMLGDKETRGKGYGIDTIMATMRYAFDELHLARLDGAMIEYNEASLGVYIKRCAWKEEGRQRNWFFRKGRYWDKVVVGVTREDYYALVEQNGYWK